MIQDPFIFREYSLLTIVTRNAQIYLSEPAGNISEAVIASFPAAYISRVFKPFPGLFIFTGSSTVFLFALVIAGIVFDPAVTAYFWINFWIIRMVYHLLSVLSQL